LFAKYFVAGLMNSDREIFSGHHLVEDAIRERGLTRRIALRVPHLTNIAAVLASTDLVLTFPSWVARVFAARRKLRILPLPFPIPSFDVSLYWQPHTEDTVAQQWFCNTIFSTLSKL
jgi:DNA-binding transcriptional LysR family regulator